MIVVEGYFAGVEFSLDHPRVGGAPYSGTVTASTEADGFEASNAQNPMTDRWWRPTAVTATWALDFGESLPVSYIGIAAHDCGTVGATLNFQTWDGSDWVTRATHTPADDSAIFVLLRRTNHEAARVEMTGAIGTIGVVYIGDVREFPQRSDYVGSVPFNETAQDETSVAVSDGGQWLDTFVTRRAGSASMSVQHISEDWNEAYLQPMLEDMKTRPVFIADRPGPYPQSVAYAYTTAKPQVARDLPNRRASRSVQFDLVAHVS